MDDVRKPSPQVAAMADAWAMIDALMGGTADMRKAGTAYLPQMRREDPADYRERLSVATLFPAYERTVSVLVGKPFSKPLTIGEDVPPRIAEMLEDCDREGRNLHNFAAEIATDMLAFGFAGILVDCPPNPVVAEGRKPSVADERAAGVRPYFVHVHPQQVLGWRSGSSSGRHTLEQLRILETQEEPSGEFGVTTVEQVRVLEPGRWTIYRKVAATGMWVIHQQGTTTLQVIPFIPLYGKRTRFMTGRPPMLELAHANVEHWQSKSDQQTILHVARVPILFVKGMGDQEIVVGANSFISAGTENADVRYVEHTGKAIEAGRVSLLDVEDRMRQAGAELLVIKPGNATRVQVMSDNEMAKCDLQRMVQGLEDGLDEALELMGAWIGETGETGHVEVYDDFGAPTLAEAGASLLLSMQQTGTLSHETLLSELKRRGTISPDVDTEQEITTAKAEFAEKQAAIQEQEKISVG